MLCRHLKTNTVSRRTFYSAVAGLGLSISTISPLSANQSNNQPIIGYEIDPESCEVTITSDNPLRAVEIRDQEGLLIEKWSKIQSNTFTIDDPAILATLPENTVIAKAGEKRGRKTRQLLPQEFSNELSQCMTSATCPEVLADRLQIAVIDSIEEDVKASCIANVTVSLTTPTPATYSTMYTVVDDAVVGWGTFPAIPGADAAYACAILLGCENYK